jgi:hypothetical protein
MLVRIEEQPFSAINVTQVSGDMRQYIAHWDIQPVTQNGVEGTRIRFTGTMEPDFFVPPLIGKPAMLTNLRKQVEAVLAEIERRGGN